MLLGRLTPLLFLLVVSLLVTGPAGPASAEDPAPTTLRLTGTSAYADQPSTLGVLLADAAGSGVPAATVVVERRVGGTWRPFTTLTTDDAGAAETDALLSKVPDDNVFRATYAGDATTYAGSASGAVAIALVRRTSVLRLGGPGSVVDEKSVPIEVTWRTGTGDPVAGEVEVYRRVGSRWRLDRRVGTAADGIVRFEVTPRTDTRWQARAGRLAWVAGRPQHHPRHRQPAAGHAGPAAGRRPEPEVKPPAQRHAVGAGPNTSITTSRTASGTR